MIKQLFNELMQSSASGDPRARGGSRRYLDSTQPSEYVPETGEVDLGELSLQGLADLYGSDKGTIKHLYTTVYTDIISQILGREERASAKLKLVEFGVACGASLRMWANYLPSSEIYGIDIREECMSLCADSNNIHIEIGDIAQQGIFAGKTACLGSLCDLIIDDASHISEDILNAFRLSWDKVRPGGFYVIEDLACTYNPAYTNEFRTRFRSSAENNRGTVLQMIDSIMRHIDTKGTVEALSYYPQMLVIRKRK
jgi:hypothetical protein